MDATKYAARLARQLESARKRRQEAIDAGLCAGCKKSPPREGRRLCQACADQEREYQRRHHTGQARKPTGPEVLALRREVAAEVMAEYAARLCLARASRPAAHTPLPERLAESLAAAARAQQKEEPSCRG